jgi:hypothetical protein
MQLQQVMSTTSPPTTNPPTVVPAPSDSSTGTLTSQAGASLGTSARPSPLASSTLWAFLGSVLLAAVFGRVALLNLTYGVVGGDIDGYENMWNNYWVKTALFDLHRSVFFTDYLYYPSGISLRFHTLNPINGLLTAPFNAAIGYVPTTNLLFLAALVLTAFCTFLLIRDFVGNPWASFGGAAVFTFANPLVLDYFSAGQAEKLSAQWLPLYLFFMFRAVNGVPIWRVRPSGDYYVERRQDRYWYVNAVFAVATLVIMALTDWQYVMHSVFLTMLYFVFVLCTRRSWLDKRIIFGRLAAIGGAFTLIVGPTMLIPMLREASESPWLIVGFNAQWRALDLLDIVSPFAGHPGYLVFGLALLGAWVSVRNGTEKRSAALFWALASVLFYIMALGPVLVVGGKETSIPLPYTVLQNIPVFNIGRDPGRFSTIATLGVCILAAWGLVAAFRRIRDLLSSNGTKGALAARLIAPVLAGAVVLATFIGPAVASGTARVDPPEWSDFYAQVGNEEGSFAVLDLPLFTEKGRGENHYMIYQIQHNSARFGGRWARDHKLTNPDNFVKKAALFRRLWMADAPESYVGSFYPERDFLNRTDYASQGLAILNYYRVRYIVLYKAAILPKDMPTFDALIKQALGDDAAPVYDDSVLTAYRVPSAPAPQDPLTLEVGNGWFPAGANEQDIVYRWADSSGGQPSELYTMNLTDRPLRATLQFMAYTFQNPRTLNVLLNGAPVASEPLTPQDGQKAFSITLDVPPGNNTISFTSPEPALPTGDPHDARLLSFGMYGVDLSPVANPSP